METIPEEKPIESVAVEKEEDSTTDAGQSCERKELPTIDDTNVDIPEVVDDEPAIEPEYDSYDSSGAFLRTHFNKMAEMIPSKATYFKKLGRVMSMHDPNDEDFDVDMFSNAFDSVYKSHYSVSTDEPIRSEPVAGPSKKQSVDEYRANTMSKFDSFMNS